MNIDDLISPEMLARQRTAHARTKPAGLHRNPYGIHGYRWANNIALLAHGVAAALDVPLLSVSVLDYGCGKGTLSETLKSDLLVTNYDPVTFPGLPTKQSHIVVCTDVLLFVEPNKLGNVIAHIKSLASHKVFIGIPDHPPTKYTPIMRLVGFNKRTFARWVEMLRCYFPHSEYKILNHYTPYLLFTGDTK